MVSRAPGQLSVALLEAGGIARLLRENLSTLAPGGRAGHQLKFSFAVREFIRSGNQSLPLIGLICVLVGMIMALQAAQQLEQFGATDRVADLVAMALTRELAPLLTAIIVTGRYGSAIAAELAAMQVAQEIDAYRVMGIDPNAYLVAPRLLGLILAVPCLEVFASAAGILGGWIMAVLVLDLSSWSYLTNSLDALLLADLLTGLVKALLFGVIIGLICCYRGLSVGNAATQVSPATTTAVVRSIVLVIVADLFITTLSFQVS